MKFKIQLQLTDEELDALIWILHDADINNMSNKPTAKRSALRKTIGALEKQQVYRAEFREFLAWRKNKSDVVEAERALAEYESSKRSSSKLKDRVVIDVTQHNSPRPRWKKLPVYATDPNKDKK